MPFSYANAEPRESTNHAADADPIGKLKEICNDQQDDFMPFSCEAVAPSHVLYQVRAFQVNLFSGNPGIIYKINVTLGVKGSDEKYT